METRPRRVTLLYFAALRDAAEAAEESLELPDSVGTVGALSSFLEAHRAGLAGRLGAVRFAVNEEFATADRALVAGDVVALIPPVSGG